jgi:hypothetical protein
LYDHAVQQGSSYSGPSPCFRHVFPRYAKFLVFQRAPP